MIERIAQQLQRSFENIYVIVSPPRCSSTALARVFWEHPAIRYYAHEPFETSYFRDDGLEAVYRRLQQPLDLLPVKRQSARRVGRALLIKEMPYQVGPYFDQLAALATRPLVFLIRDPRINISSRMKMKMEVNDSPLFPLRETGWQLLAAQIALCQEAGIPYLIVDSRAFRNAPNVVLKELFSRLRLPFFPEQTAWRARVDVKLDNLDGSHAHLYRRVLGSDRLLPDDDPLPSLEWFPETGGLRRHVQDCLQIYQRLKNLPQTITQGAE